jgi:L-seryl-tRNA(Ser) seleniumtransferase
MEALLRELPSVDSLLRLPLATDLSRQYGHGLTSEGLRYAVAAQRSAIRQGQGYVSMPALLLQGARDWLETILASSLQPVINATGIIVHTNLGRAPLCQSAIEAISEVAAGYSTLEYDFETGTRGSRSLHCEPLLTRLVGTEAALVVNNNAAAVLLMLTALCRGTKVVISRGQLVEIGGGFRLPDVMAQSGAQLVEVGTTNRTHLRDYEAAIDDDTSAILVAHRSNYRIIGFTGEPALPELAHLAHQRGIRLLYDQGSGALLDVTRFGLEPEPTVLEGVQAGADVLAFSGDKLLGGPQAGILCGAADVIGRLKKHPLARAVRADKMCLAALAATLKHYLTDQALTKIPVWRMIARPLPEIEVEAEKWATRLSEQGVQAKAMDGLSMVGGGSLPGTSLPTRVVAVEVEHVDEFARYLRSDKMPLVGRIQDESFLIDPRSVLPEQADRLIEIVVRGNNRLARPSR